MTLFIISVPLMIVAVAIAVIPLIAMSHKHHRRVAAVHVEVQAPTQLRHDSAPALPTAA